MILTKKNKEFIEFVKNEEEVTLRRERGITEAEYQGKKVQLNKPKRGGASGKKFYVYVKDGDKVKKVSFGDSGGLSTKVFPNRL